MNENNNSRYNILQTEANGGLTEEMADRVMRIGYYRHKETFGRKILFDLEEGCFYESDDTPHCMEIDDIDVIKSLPKLFSVSEWNPYYQDEEKVNGWHSFKWKLVFEVKEGVFAYGGYTESLSSVPERFWEMDAIIRAILRGEKVELASTDE